MGARLGKVITVGLAVAVMFTALAYGAVEPWSVTLFELLVAALVLVWALKMWADREVTITLPPIAFPMMALLAVGAVQSISIAGSNGVRRSLSFDVDATRSAMVVLAALFIFFVIAATVLDKPSKLAGFTNFLIIFGLAVAIFGLIQHFTWNGRYYWIRQDSGNPSPFGPFANHNHFAGYMEMLAPIPVGLIMTRAVRGEIRLFYGFAAAVMGIALLASLSRAGMLSLVAGLAFTVFARARAHVSGLKTDDASPGHKSRHLHNRKPLLRAVRTFAPLAVLLAAITLGVFWVGADPVINRIQTTSAPANPSQSFSSTRGWIWRDSVLMIKANPILGVGLGAFGAVFPIYSRSDGTYYVAQSHNDYLQIVADCGVVGAVIALWFLAGLFRVTSRGLKSSDPTLSGLAIGVGGGLTAILVHSLFDFNLQIPSNALLFLVLSSIAAGVAVAAPETALLPVEVASVAAPRRAVGVAARY
jgi:O-antigen ligase